MSMSILEIFLEFDEKIRKSQYCLKNIKDVKHLKNIT